ncbi:Levanase [Pseudolycoriella hygida]|uniref:Levanase n=1 Tax=Pseudolycoriella hygida TaxID=35572 RepID=A0A9Q0RZY7_9DIPT|nr:Levanase [Pseudolycoriella hygida]
MSLHVDVSIRILIFLCTLLFLKECHAQNCLNDKYRPQLHYSPAKNWLNDPNGLVYLAGEYHMFYQYYPDGTVWGPMHWGHAITSDLVHWEELPIALYPNALGDIFSGSAVVDFKNTSGLQTGGDPPLILIFTQASGNTQLQSIAVSNDRGRSFGFYAGNPVLQNTDKTINDFRDPKVFYMNDKWIMSLAVKNKIQMFSSNNLKNWTKLGEFGAVPLQGAHGGVWECPDLLSFTLDGLKLWVLLVSINPGGPNNGSATQYFIGTFDGRQFRKTGIYQNLWMDWGPDNYAGVTFSNEPKNRKLLIAWMNNWDYGQVLPTVAWRGQMTLPRVLDLQRIDGKPRLLSTPAVEVESLRNLAQFYETTRPLWIRSRHDFTNDLQFNNSLLEVDGVFDTQLTINDPSATFSICFYNGLAEEVCVGYNFGTNNLFFDRSNSGDTSFYGNFGQISYANRETRNKILQLKLYLDTSAIEIFADGGYTTMTGLFFPTQLLTGVRVKFSSGIAVNQLKILSMTIRGLKSIYNC